MTTPNPDEAKSMSDEDFVKARYPEADWFLTTNSEICIMGSGANLLGKSSQSIWSAEGRQSGSILQAWADARRRIESAEAPAAASEEAKHTHVHKGLQCANCKMHWSEFLVYPNCIPAPGRAVPDAKPDAEEKPLVSECCNRHLYQNCDRYCPRCGWECRVKYAEPAQPKPDAAGEAKEAVWMGVILGHGGIGVGPSRNNVTGALSVLFQELTEPLEIGAKADPNISPERDVIEVRIESVEAADVLLHAVKTVRDVLAGDVGWQETRDAYNAMDRLPSAPPSRDQSELLLSEMENLRNAFAAYIRDRLHTVVMDDDEVGEIMQEWIDAEQEDDDE